MKTKHFKNSDVTVLLALCGLSLIDFYNLYGARAKYSLSQVQRYFSQFDVVEG